MPQKELRNIYPVDANIVYCAGQDKTLLKTTNGGENWIILQDGEIGVSSGYFGLFFLNSMTGWLGGSNQHVFKTTNGGINWDSVFVSITGTDIYFKDFNYGVMCGLED